MTVIAVLLILLFNLTISFGLAAILYFLVVLPIKADIRSLSARKPGQKTKAQAQYEKITGSPLYVTDLDDLPEDSSWGDDEPDYKTSPEEVEDELTNRSYNTYREPRTSSIEQLRGLGK